MDAINPLLTSNSSIENTTQSQNENFGSAPVQTNDKMGERQSFDEKEVRRAVEKANRNLEQNQHDVRYQIHKETHRLMVQVIDHKTKQIISEMPPGVILDLVASFNDNRTVAIDKKV